MDDRRVVAPGLGGVKHNSYRPRAGPLLRNSEVDSEAWAGGLEGLPERRLRAGGDGGPGPSALAIEVPTMSKFSRLRQPRRRRMSAFTEV